MVLQCQLKIWLQINFHERNEVWFEVADLNNMRFKEKYGLNLAKQFKSFY